MSASPNNSHPFPEKLRETGCSAVEAGDGGNKQRDN